MRPAQPASRAQQPPAQAPPHAPQANQTHQGPRPQRPPASHPHHGYNGPHAQTFVPRGSSHPVVEFRPKGGARPPPPQQHTPPPNAQGENAETNGEHGHTPPQQYGGYRGNYPRPYQPYNPYSTGVPPYQPRGPYNGSYGRGGRGPRGPASQYVPRGQPPRNQQMFYPQMYPGMGYMPPEMMYGQPNAYGAYYGPPVGSATPTSDAPSTHTQARPVKRESKALPIFNPETNEQIKLFGDDKPASKKSDTPRSDETASEVPTAASTPEKQDKSSSPGPEAPASEAEAPTPEPEAPASEPEAPTSEAEAPTPEAEAPTPEPEAPTPEAEACTSKIEAPKTKEEVQDPEELKRRHVEVKKDATTGKITYSMSDLMLFKNVDRALPSVESGREGEWPSMEITREEFHKTRGGRGGNWERGIDKQGGRGNGRSRNVESSWNRGQEAPRRGGRGGRGRGRGQAEVVLEGPVKPLERSENRWVPSKSTSNLETTEKLIKSILNKMTKEKFDRLAQQMTEIKVESIEMLQAVIRIIFDKAITEPHFSDLYGDLCVHLENNWKVHSFVKIVQNDDDGHFYWTAIPESDSDVVGPFDSVSKTLASAHTQDFEPMPSPEGMRLMEVHIQRQKFIKVWTLPSKTTDSPLFYWSGQMLQDIPKNEGPVGPFESHEMASQNALKTNNFRRLLLNACQEEYEKGNMYHDVEETLRKARADKSLTPEKETELEERRLVLKQRMLGNIRFIGEVFRKGMLRETIVHECIMKLMGVHVSNEVLVRTHPEQAPDEENIESLCKLLSTMGKELDKSTSESLDVYFSFMEKNLLKDKRMSSRIRFMVQDLIDLRGNKWVPRRKQLQQKTIAEIRKEAEKEQRQPPASAPGGPRPDSFRDTRRGANGGGSQRQTTAPVYNNASMRNNSSLRMPLVEKKTAQEESVNSDLRRRPTSFGSAPKRPGSTSTSATTATSKSVKKLDEDSLNKVKREAKVTSDEYVENKDIDEASTCLEELQKSLESKDEATKHFVKHSLLYAVEAKDATRMAVFDMITQLVNKQLIPSACLQFALAHTCSAGVMIWCDVPKMDAHMADLVLRFMPYKKNYISLDWLVCLCGREMDVDAQEDAVDSGFLAAVAGRVLQHLAREDPARAKEQVHATYVSLLSLLPANRRTPVEFKKWIDTYGLEDVLQLNLAIDLATQLEKSDNVAEWIQENIPPSRLQDSVFATHASLLILNATKDDQVPSSESCFLVLGFSGHQETQARLISALVQTKKSNEHLEKTLRQLQKEGTMRGPAFAKWLELQADHSVARQKALEELGNVWQELAKAK